jgi:serine/threonine-protein kinase RsbT
MYLTHIRIAIRSDGDLTRAILTVQQEAEKYGFDSASISKLATALSELTRNILKYAGHGAVSIRILEDSDAGGMEIEARDRGPGIADIDAALQDHVSTGRTLGLGLPGVKRMMDDFTIKSERGHGTCVTVRKWRRP